MRILLLNNEFPPIGGGGSLVTYYVGRYLAKAGHEVRLLTSRYGTLPHDETVDGIRVHRLPAIRKHADSSSVGELLTFIATASWFGWKIGRQFRPDFIQAYFGVPAGGVAYLLHRLLGTPYGIYLGGSDVPGANPGRYGGIYPFITPFIRLFWREASLLIAASQQLLSLAHAVEPHLNIQVIPNGVDLARFRPNPGASAHSPVRILSIGRLIPRKGFQHLIRAVALVRNQTNQTFSVDIVGSGPYHGALVQLTRQLGLESLVPFAGAVPYEDLHRAYQGAHIFVLPSQAEGMALVLLEAMACGLPIVATRVGGSEELVHSGENGYLVDVGDIEGVAEALVALIEDPPLRQGMGQKSLQSVQEYDWNRIAHRHLRWYERALKS